MPHCGQLQCVVPRSPELDGIHALVCTCAQAFVTCLEVVRAGGTTGRILATNVFERQDGTWKIVLHHGSIPPPDMAL